MLLLLSACSLLNKGKKYVASENAIVPEDREVVQAQQKEVDNKYSAQDLKQGCIRSDWAIQTVMGKPAVGEDVPYLKFEPKKGMVYGNDGCNTINAGYKYNPQDSTLTLSNPVSTMKYCAGDDLTDSLVKEALDRTRRYTWYDENFHHYVVLLDNSGNELMTLMHQEFDFLNGIWAVTAINGVKQSNPDMKLVIDVDEHSIHGNTGCNILNGSLEINPKTVNSVSFFSIATTLRACPDREQETAFVVALEEVVYAVPLDARNVQLLNNKHEVVLKLTRSAN